jgi:transcription elongation factor GreA
MFNRFLSEAPQKRLSTRPRLASPANSATLYNDNGRKRFRSMMDIKKKLQDEIAILEHEFHVELPKAILTARAHGDLSENAEYHSAKDRQGFVNARLGQLRKRLADLSMVDFTKIPIGKVGLGSTVVVLDTKREEEITYHLVTSEEADAANGRISATSPIGRALLNKEEGDVVKVQSPGGTKELEIRKLTTIHDAVT